MTTRWGGDPSLQGGPADQNGPLHRPVRCFRAGDSPDSRACWPSKCLCGEASASAAHRQSRTRVMCGMVVNVSVAC